MSTDDAREAFYSALLGDDPATLYDRAPCGYLSSTPDGLIVKVNQTLLTMTGYRRDELVGRRTFAQLLSAGGRIYHETHLRPMLQLQGRLREIAVDVVRADGSRLPMLVNAVLETDPAGVPLVTRMALFDATHRREYERELLRAKERAEAAQALAEQAQARAERARAEAAALARTLQETLIPPTPAAIPGLDVAAAYRPAGDGSEVGGDFYDVFEVRDGDWIAVIGDVSGKGREAAVVTALARYTVRAACVRRADPSHALDVLNEVLLRHETERFATVAILRLHHIGPGWSVTVGCGGHPLPLLVRPGRRPIPTGRPGSLLGVQADARFVDHQLTLEPGDTLVLYTDGVTEARSGREFYGEERLDAALERAPADAAGLTRAVLADVLTFQGDVARDDIAVVTVRVPD